MSANEEIIINAILAGTREYLANAQRVVAGNEEIAGSTEMVGRSMERTSKRSYLMNQAIFTTRRLMYGLTLATVGSAVAATKWGWDFNSAMQSARVALGPLQSDTFNVNKELDYLFNFTKYTPFQFKDITVAFRQMYGAMAPLGMSANDVNGYIKAMVDALSFAGRTSPGALNRVAVALQHVAFQGHLTGQAVTQLARDGLPIYAALKKELGLTGEQMHAVGKLGIPVNVALKALHDYIESTPGFMNAAHRQAVSTFHGLFTTFKDNTSQIMGYMEKGFFLHMQARLADMNHWFDRVGKVAHDSGGNVQKIMYAIGGPGAVMMWNRLTDATHQFWILFVTVSGTIGRSHVFWAAIYGVLLAISIVLHLINPFLQAFGGILVGLLIPAIITWYTVTKIAAFWTGVMALEEALATKATKELSFFQFLAAVATGRYALAQKLAAFWTAAGTLAMRGYVIATTLLTWALRQETIAAVVAWAATLGPITLILIGLAAVAAAIFLVIKYWKELKSVAGGGWIRSQLGISEGAGGGGKYSGGGILGNWLSNKGVPTWLTGAHRAAHMAAGGTVSRGGLSWVGERGPELLSLPVGASVMPNHDAFNMHESWMGSSGGVRTIIVKTFLDRRQIGEAVADLQAEDQARA